MNQGMKDGLPLHLLSAGFSGFWAALFSTPADVIKSRVMAGGKDSIIGTTKEIITKEGLPVLWRGFWQNWTRLAPWQLTFWVTYEQMRFVFGHQGFQ